MHKNFIHDMSETLAINSTIKAILGSLVACYSGLGVVHHETKTNNMEHVQERHDTIRYRKQTHRHQCPESRPVVPRMGLPMPLLFPVRHSHNHKIIWPCLNWHLTVV